MAVDVVKRCRVKAGFDLARHDPDETFGWDKDTAKARASDVLVQVADLQERLFAEGEQAVLVVLQAMDGGGKDSTIRNVLSTVNVAGVVVTSFGVPSEEDAAHDFLWRVHQRTPSKGSIGVFNRSHYEDVLVVRVKQLVPEPVWRKRYEHIREFEQQLVDEGTAVVKLFLHISKDEQRQRMQDRVDDPTKRWKFRMGDLDDRAMWDDYMQAYAEALSETSKPDAPWYVVPANRKWVRNLVVAEILLHHLSQIDPQFPPAEPGIEGLVIE
jgi:PPK2 family polyphosphate:nucleotide phosphotransferase